MKFYTIHEFSKLVGKTPQTLRNWDKKDIACRLQGKRANKAKKFVKELLSDD